MKAFAIGFGLLILTSASCGEDKKSRKAVPYHPQIVSNETTGIIVVNAASDGIFLEANTLQIDLTRTPAPGTAAVPQCFDAFASGFQIGTVTCSETGATAPLFAGNVNQVCADVGMLQEATTKLEVTGCRQAALSLFKFEPALTLKR